MDTLVLLFFSRAFAGDLIQINNQVTDAKLSTGCSLLRLPLKEEKKIVE